MQDVSGGAVAFLTIPTQGTQNIDGRGDVVAVDPTAVERFVADAIGPENSAAEDDGPAPSTIPVDVRNASGAEGAAARVVAVLSAQGYARTVAGNAEAPAPRSEVLFGPAGDAAGARGRAASATCRRASTRRCRRTRCASCSATTTTVPARRRRRPAGLTGRAASPRTGSRAPRRRPRRCPRPSRRSPPRAWPAWTSLRRPGTPIASRPDDRDRRPAESRCSRRDPARPLVTFYDDATGERSNCRARPSQLGGQDRQPPARLRRRARRPGRAAAARALADRRGLLRSWWAARRSSATRRPPTSSSPRRTPRRRGRRRPGRRVLPRRVRAGPRLGDSGGVLPAGAVDYATEVRCTATTSTR